MPARRVCADVGVRRVMAMASRVEWRPRSRQLSDDAPRFVQNTRPTSLGSWPAYAELRCRRHRRDRAGGLPAPFRPPDMPRSRTSASAAFNSRRARYSPRQGVERCRSGAASGRAAPQPRQGNLVRPEKMRDAGCREPYRAPNGGLALRRARPAACLTTARQ